MRDRIDYDRLAHDYARARGAIPRVVDAILEGVGEGPVRDILEVGCGPADHLRVLAKAFGAAAHGFDRSASMLEEAARKNPGLALTKGDASVAYPYSDARFDLVFSVNVIHYIADLDRYFGEARRVLRPGGTVVTVTDSWDDIRRRTMTEYFPQTAAAEFQRYQDTPPIERAMRGAGFGDIRLTHSEYHFDLTREYLEKYRQKAFSALRLIEEDAFRAGLDRLEAAVAAGGGRARELYTYVWGRKS